VKDKGVDEEQWWKREREREREKEREIESSNHSLHALQIY